MAELIVRKEGHTGWLIFSNVARHNAMTYDMWKGMPAALADFDADPNVRVIALKGDGDKAFVSGADISEFADKRGSADATAEYNRATKAATIALRGTVKPAIAVIRGICFGGGAGLAVSCDMRIAADDSRFCVPAARLGLGYEYDGVSRLMSIVGPAYTAEIFSTARRYTAAEAHHMGLVNHVRPVAEFDAFVAEYIGSICENAPMTVATELRAIDEAMKPESQRDLALIQTMVDRCFASEDYKEGRTAFMEKRKPQFKGR